MNRRSFDSRAVIEPRTDSASSPVALHGGSSRQSTSNSAASASQGRPPSPMDIVTSVRSFPNLDYSHRNPYEPMDIFSTDNLPAGTSYLEVKCTATTVFAVRCPKFWTCARQGEVKFQDRFRHQCMRNCWCNRRIAGTPDPQTSSPPRNLHTVQRTQLNSRVSMGDPQRPRKPRNHGHPA